MGVVICCGIVGEVGLCGTVRVHDIDFTVSISVRQKSDFGAVRAESSCRVIARVVRKVDEVQCIRVFLSRVCDRGAVVGRVDDAVTVGVRGAVRIGRCVVGTIEDSRTECVGLAVAGVAYGIGETECIDFEVSSGGAAKNDLVSVRTEDGGVVIVFVPVLVVVGTGGELCLTGSVRVHDKDFVAPVAHREEGDLGAVRAEHRIPVI